MRKLLPIVITLLFLVSCSKNEPNKQVKSTSKIDSLIDYERLIEFEDIFTDVKVSSTIIKDSGGSVLISPVTPVNLTKNEQGLQVIKISNKERRAPVPMTIDEGLAVTGITIENTCPANLNRRQTCYLKILLDSVTMTENTTASKTITINGESMTFQYTIDPAPAEDYSSKLEIRNASQDCGDLLINDGESCEKVYQIVNISRSENIPVSFDDSGFTAGYSYSTNCPATLNRRRSCYAYINIDSTGLTAGAVSSDLTVAGSLISTLSATLIEKTPEQIESENLAKLQIDASNIDLGDVEVGLSVSKKISIKNISRESVPLNIDGSGLVEFSLSGCPANLSRLQTCYLEITYDASGATVGAKTETFSISGGDYSPLANVIASSIVACTLQDAENNGWNISNALSASGNVDEGNISQCIVDACNPTFSLDNTNKVCVSGNRACTLDDAQANGFLTTNIEMVTGLVSNGNVSQCSIACAQGYVLKTNSCQAIPDVTALNNIRIGDFYNYSKGSNNVRGLTGLEADFLTQMSSAKITQVRTSSGDYHPLFKDRFNYYEQNFPDGNDYPFVSGGDATFEKSYASFNVSGTDTLAINDMQKFFNVEGIAGSTIDGLYYFNGVMYKGGRCFIVGRIDKALVSNAEQDQIGAISVFDDQGTYDPQTSVTSFNQSMTRSQCESIKEIFEGELGKYYEFKNEILNSIDNIDNVNDSWAAKLDLRHNGSSLSYGGSSLNIKAKYSDLKDIFAGLSMSSNELDSNYSANGFHYLKMNSGLSHTGSQVEGFLGFHQDVTTSNCSLMFKVNGQATALMSNMLLKDGTQTERGCSAGDLVDIRDAMGLTDSDVTAETLTVGNDKYYYYKEVVAVALSTNPFFTNRTTVTDFFDMIDSNMTYYNEYQLYQPSAGQDANSGVAGGTLTGSLGGSFTMHGYVTLARNDNSTFNWPTHRGIYIARYAESYAPNGNYFLKFLPITWSGFTGNASTDSYPYNSYGSPSDGGSFEIVTGVWQLIAEYNHSLKIVRGIVPAITAFPTGITTKAELDAYIAGDANAQLIVQDNPANPIASTYDEMFYSIKQ